MTSSPPAERRLTIQAGLRGSDNAFGVIRLVLASSVILSHAFPLGGWGNDPIHGWTHGQESIGGFAVVGFFVVSGYLITKSGARTDIVQFLWHRVLRIYPAFLVVITVTAVVIAPAIWIHMGRPLGEYWTTAPGGPLTYIVDNARLTIYQWGIHDLLVSTTPYGGAFNGSLWTLVYEWRAYLVIAALLLIGALRRLPYTVAAATASVYILCVFWFVGGPNVGEIAPWLAERFTLTLTLAFLIGGTLAVLSNRIILDGRLAIIAGAAMVTTLLTSGWVIVGYPAFAYVIMYLAARIPGWWRRIGAKNDYSYGIYVYGFLVQQVTAYLGWYRWGYVPWVIVTLALTSMCAFASWHLVEKRALALKKYGPGRGVNYWLSRTRWARFASPGAIT